MKQVLLAINGDIPTNSVFQYAVSLCTRISADLKILQFIGGRKLTQCLSSTKKKVRSIGHFLEDSFAGIAFAEHGEFYMADEILSGVSEPLKEMLTLNDSCVSFTVILSDGEPETDLSRYIEENRDIVLTIFDPSVDTPVQPGLNLAIIDQIKQNLSVPLVVVSP